MCLEKLDTVSDISSSSSEEQEGDEELLGRSPDSEEAMSQPSQVRPLLKQRGTLTRQTAVFQIRSFMYIKIYSIYCNSCPCISSKIQF